MKISICTQILDWNFGLKESLPTWLNFPCDEIIIFDFNSGKESAKDIVDLYPDPRIKLLTAAEYTPFNTSVGRNLSINNSTGDIIFYLDADVKIQKPLNIKHLPNKVFMQGCKVTREIPPSTKEYNPFYYYTPPGKSPCKYWTSLSGGCIFWKSYFYELNGFDERMQGWGYNDSEFYVRLGNLGCKRVDFPLGFLKHIEHSTEKRISNFDNKNIFDSELKNKDLSRIKCWDKSFQRKQIKLNVIS